MSEWTCTQLTFGSGDSRFHSHSYYDIPVLDSAARRVLVHRMNFAERQPTPEDEVEVGVVDLDEPGSWTSVGKTTAWSWQQGPMAQWLGGGSHAIYNDREDGRFVSRLVDTESGEARTLPRPTYAVSADGKFVYGLNMARLDHLRPGYGYAGGDGALLEQHAPESDGVWKMPIEGGKEELLLSLAEAQAFLLSVSGLRTKLEHSFKKFTYWFNHLKLSPDNQRFTVKLRWRMIGGKWNETQGVSLTGSTHGGDLRLLADATSHVLWLNDEQLYFWRKGEVALFADTSPRGTRLSAIAPDKLQQNVHIRHLPPSPQRRLDRAVYDTPYQEEVTLRLLLPDGGMKELASFAGHVPPRGPFRCDLHPVPSANGQTIIVTSLQDGGRQVYALTAQS